MKRKTIQECIIELQSLRLYKRRLQQLLDSHEAVVNQLRVNMRDVEDRLIGIELEIGNHIKRENRHDKNS